MPPERSHMWSVRTLVVLSTLRWKEVPLIVAVAEQKRILCMSWSMLPWQLCTIERTRASRTIFRRQFITLCSIVLVLEGLNIKEVWGFWEDALICINRTNKFKKLTNPVLTRWWLVGACAAELDKKWNVWKMAIKGARNLPKRKYKKGNKSSALQDIAAATLNLMKQDEFRVYIKFIANLHTFYISLHSDYFQKGNHLSENVPGYQGRLITKQYFLMSEDLEDCRNLMPYFQLPQLRG